MTHPFITRRLRDAHLRDVTAAARHLSAVRPRSFEAGSAENHMRKTLAGAFRAGCPLADVALAAGLPASVVAQGVGLTYVPPVDTESEGAYLIGGAA